MSKINYQIERIEQDFQTNYLPFNEIQSKLDSEIQPKTQKDCMANMNRLHKKLFCNTKRIIAKLCYALGKFSPFDPVIKQSFEDIQRLQNQWYQFTNKNKNNNSYLQQPQVDFVKSLKRQQGDIKRIKDNLEIKIVPIISKLNPLKTSLVRDKTYPIFNSIKSQIEQSNQSLQLNQQKDVIPILPSEYRFKLKDQFYHIKQFVFFQLHPKLKLQFDRVLHKKVVLNCYIQWNRKINRQLKITQMAKLQMELTVQIKQKFPNLETKRKFFKGIGFREQFINEINLTDRKPIAREQDKTLEDECIIHPIDQIIKLARSSQKSDIQKLYNEQQLRALDKALGLI